MELTIVGREINEEMLADAIWFCLVDVYNGEIESTTIVEFMLLYYKLGLMK